MHTDTTQGADTINCQKVENMKIYLSGKISGTDLDYVRRLFDKVATTLRALGHEVTNPLCNGLSEAAPWEEHMAKTSSTLWIARGSICYKVGRIAKEQELSML